MLLADMLAKDRDALICDMAETYGVFSSFQSSPAVSP